MQKIDSHKTKYDVMCVGRVVLDVYMYPTVRKDLKGNFSVADNLNYFIGGSAANTAFVLNRLGASSVLAGAVGSDIMGRMLIQKLKGCKLFSRNICKLNTHTSASFITLGNDREPIFTHIEGANQHFSPSDVNRKVLEKSRFLHLGGVYLLPEFDNGKVTSVITFAKKHGIRISADATHNLLHHELLHNYNGVDLMFMNYEEAYSVTNTKSIKKMSALFKSNFNFKTVVIKLGEKGCVVVSDDGYKIYRGYEIAPVDQCGAGDAFVAGYLYGSIKEWSEYKTAKFANACGAQTCLYLGPTNDKFAKKDVVHNYNFMEDEDNE